ncbi:hypothetical protein BG005_001961, partial [Podila minutissima]
MFESIALHITHITSPQPADVQDKPCLPDYAEKVCIATTGGMTGDEEFKHIIMGDPAMDIIGKASNVNVGLAYIPIGDMVGGADGCWSYQEIIFDEGSTNCQPLCHVLGTWTFQVTALNLTAAQIMVDIRAHYYGAKFDEPQPDNENTINFFRKNDMAHWYKDFPKASLAPSFIYFSEVDLAQVLFKDPPCWEIISRTMECTSLTMLEKNIKHTKGLFMKQ